MWKDLHLEKPELDYKLLNKFLEKLNFLRRYRAKKKGAIPLVFRLAYYRNLLRHQVDDNWKACYVQLESGDFFYIPDNIDVHGTRLALKPYDGISIVDKFCKPGSAVIDIGANIGEWTLPMAKAVGNQGKVFSFEPIPFMCEAVNKTVRANGLFHAQCVPVAISNRAGEAKFFLNYSEDKVVDSGASSLEYSPSQHAKEIVVQTMTLDEAVENLKINDVSFIKIDVEGHEYAVIDGARKTLKKFSPVLLVEVGNETEDKRGLIAGALEDLNYEIIGIVINYGIVPCDYGNFVNYTSPFRKGAILNVLFIPKTF